MNELNRRGLLNAAAAASVAAPVTVGPVCAAAMDVESQERGDHADIRQPERIVDTNVHLFQWPFRRLPLDTTSAMVAKLRSLGITQAWAGNFEAVLHRDISSVNARLHSLCAEYPELVAVGAINPTLPGWEEDLRRCIEVHDMPVLRLYPGYHGYRLDDARVASLTERATAAKRLIQVAATLEDRRTQNAPFQVDDVDLSLLLPLVERVPSARFQVLNLRPAGNTVGQLAKADQILFDTARVDTTDGIRSLLGQVSAQRVLFGSHSPFLIPEAALIRVRENDLTNAQRDDVLWRNATLVGQGGDSR